MVAEYKSREREQMWVIFQIRAQESVGEPEISIYIMYFGSETKKRVEKHFRAIKILLLYGFDWV